MTLVLPERPPSEVEWEDLLVKLDIAPRAVRAAVEDAGPGAAVLSVLTDAVAREAWFAEALARLSAGETLPAENAPGERDDASAAVLLETLDRARGRNFAQVQRRGLGVWDWRAPTAGGGEMTGYQLLQHMQRFDGETIARLRRG